MKNPPHPGGLIKDELNALGVSITAAASGLGVSRSMLARVTRCLSPITAELAVRLELGLGGSADFWLRMQISHDLAQVRQKPERIKVKPLTPKVA